MTTEQYQKRIHFLEYIKNNYIAIYGYQLIFYFENYDVVTIDARYLKDETIISKYYFEHSDQESGSVILGHGFDGNLILYLEDTYCFILYNLTGGHVDQNDLKTPINTQMIKEDLLLLYSALKGK